MDNCYLCKSNERDEVKYGEFMTRGDISVHYYCLLLTSNLLQRGHDNQEFLGFLVADIKEEAYRVATAVCCYCKKKSANISCCAPKCRKTFHMTCGVKNDAENQFVGTFKSYCNRHVIGKKIRPPSANETCCICYESILDENGKFNCVTMLRAPCCKNGWFHKWCLAAFASSAGYFFKCPLCNDNKVFRQRLVYKGIFIPDRDAAWELEPNAFAELLERPRECSASVCNAKGGRFADSNRNKLIFCATCGSVAIHRSCSMIGLNENFVCDECNQFNENVNNSNIVNISASQQTDSDEDEDVDVDVCEEDDDAPVLSNSRIPDSDEDEGTVQSFVRVKKNGHRIFDDEMSSGDEASDNDNIVQKKKSHTKANRLLSSDSGSPDGSGGVNLDDVGSRDAESLFDSGAESDRSGSSRDKFNTNNSTNISTNNCNSTVKPKNMDNLLVVKKKQVENLGATLTRGRRFTSLNDSPNENWCISQRTRRRSMCCVTDLDSLKTEAEHTKCLPENRRSAITTQTSKNHSVITEKIEEENVSSNRRRTQSKLSTYTDNKPTSEPGESSDSRFKEAMHNVDAPLKDSCIAQRTRRRSSCISNELYNIITRSRFRSRTKSEDPSQSLSATQRISSPRNPYTYVTRQVPSKASSEMLSSITHKRRRSESAVDYKPRPNKRCKHNSTLEENENSFHGVNEMPKKCSPRGRSPLSSNICDLYAFITPAYVKNSKLSKRDTPSATEVLQPIRPTAPEIGKLFSKDKTNISQSTAKTDSNNMHDSNNKPSRSPRNIFLQSYSMLIETPTKPKPHKHTKKRISHNFKNRNLPSNQTKIESFFKRL